jgi:patatin-like phospholipase/acyl hydrolase
MYRILSFCGGGIRGLLSAGLLNRLQEESCKGLVHDTDLLAGTSTGADIISSILAHLPTSAIYDGYKNTKIFDDPGLANDKPAYDVEKLVAVQRALHPLNHRLGDVGRSVLFTSFNVGKNAADPWKPLLLHNLPNSDTLDYHIVDCIVSSSAMPGMYGSHKGNVDGAFVSHDPTRAAIAAAVSNGHRLEDITAVCFGTGFMANWIADDTANWGTLQWQGLSSPENRTPSLLINGSVSPVLNMILNGTSTNLVPQLCEMLLGPDRYAYVNPRLDRTIPENDTNPADLRYMEELVATHDLHHAIEVVQKWWPCS